MQLLRGETLRWLLLLTAESNGCSLAAALRMVIDDAIDTTHSEHTKAASLRWLLEHAEVFELNAQWLAKFGRGR